MAPSETVAVLDKMSDEEFERHALETLRNELGAYGLARFLSTYRAGSGDYSHDRDQWLNGLTVEQALAGKS